MYSKSGDDLVIDELRARLTDECASLAIAHETLPLWTEHGIADYSCALHSAGVTYWTSLGQRFGFQALAEMPPPLSGAYAHVGVDVRSDSAWYERTAVRPCVLVEFERYAGAVDEGKLMAKVSNLLLAQHRWEESASVLVLSYWTKSVATLPNHRALKERVRNGFETAAKERVAGASRSRLLIFQTVLRETAAGTWRLWQMIERGTE
jgi:hypothetical protein